MDMVSLPAKPARCTRCQHETAYAAYGLTATEVQVYWQCRNCGLTSRLDSLFVTL